MADKSHMPQAAAPQWDTIPADLAQRQQWVLWRFEWSEKRTAWQKVPYYPMGGRRTGDQGSDRDRMRLATLNVARTAFERKQGMEGAWAGVGFAFLPGDGLMGIDLDKHVDAATGEMTDRCKNIIQAFHTFTEISVSGTGVHLYLKGHTETNKSNDIGVEMFCESQFFIVTGKHVPGTPLDVAQADEAAVRRMHATINEAKEKYKPQKPASAAQHVPSARGDRDDFRYVNDEAMRSLHSWVPALFGGREIFKGGRYRVTSKALGRDLQEDLSIRSDGIQDFGVADMGDPRNGLRTPIDLVMEWGPGTSKPAEALHWLAKVLGLTLQKPEPQKKARGAGAGAEGEPPPAAPGGGGGGKGGSGGGDPPDDGADGEDALEAKLVRYKGRPLDCRENVMYCLQLSAELQGLVRMNDFTRMLERSRPTPWGRQPGEWDEEDDLMLGEFLIRTYSLGLKAKSTLRDGVLMAARANRYNPIVDWIKAEEWDGTPRLEHWLTEVYGIDERPYTRLIGKCFMMGLVKRAIEPGCKFDYMLILKGAQGLKKSSTWRALAFPYYTDNAIRIGDKDSQMAQQLAWIVESAELESLNKSETTAIKQHLSAQEDWFRPPYGSQMVKAPRHSVHVGTTNADTFLRDATGDRRFWPLEIQTVNPDVLVNLKGQLLAEAYHRLQANERFWPDKQEERDLIFPEQEPFKRVDPWEDMLDAFVNEPTSSKVNRPAGRTRDFFASTELYDALGIKADRIDGAGQMDTRISNAMKSLGFERHRETSGLRRRGFRRKPAEAQPGAPVPEPSTPPSPPAAPLAPPGPFDAEGDDDLPF